ncbi:MAG: acyloxyacyl hydrolase [Hyphomonadaceae bacterium]
MNKKSTLAALAGYGLATLLASTPAAAQEASGETLAAGPSASGTETADLQAPPVLLSDDAPVASFTLDDDQRGERGWLSEIRLGLLAQDNGPIVNSVESGAAINFEVLFNSPRALSAIGSPRPHVGISAATDSYATSYAYAGLTWERELQQDWFLIGGFGLALHNGEYLRKSEQPPEDWSRQKTLGCRVDFHWGVGAGRRFAGNWNAALHYEHVSSADVCIKGALGIENVGIRFGRVF